MLIVQFWYAEFIDIFGKLGIHLQGPGEQDELDLSEVQHDPPKII